MRRGGLERHGSLGPEDAASTRAARGRHGLSAENVSAHDQVTQASTGPDGINAELQQHPTGSAAHDFALEQTQNLVAGHELERARSESMVESARRRMQGFADAADDDSGLQHHQANIDWEEYQTQDLQPRISQHETPIDPDFFNF